MKPMEILMEEHRLIHQALDNLSIAIERLENEEKPPVEFFQKWLELYHSFILDYHHFKEEHIMFQLLAQKKQGTLDNQIESLRYQHERGRNFVTEVEHALKGNEEGAEIQTSTLLENAAAYVSLLRHHIHREEYVFYPMAEKSFSQDEEARLQGEFMKQTEKAGGRTLETGRKLVQEIGSLLAQ